MDHKISDRISVIISDIENRSEEKPWLSADLATRIKDLYNETQTLRSTAPKDLALRNLQTAVITILRQTPSTGQVIHDSIAHLKNYFSDYVNEAKRNIEPQETQHLQEIGADKEKQGTIQKTFSDPSTREADIFFNIATPLIGAGSSDEEVESLLLKLKDAPAGDLEQISLIASYLIEGGIDGKSIINFLLKIDETPYTPTVISEIASCLIKDLGFSGAKLEKILGELKTIPDERLGALIGTSMFLARTGIDQKTVDAFFHDMKENPGFEEICGIADRLERLSDKNTSDLLLYLKDFPKENLENFLKITRSLITSEINGNSIYNFLCKLKDVPAEKLALLSSLATTLQSEEPFAKQMDTILLELKDLPIDQLKTLADLVTNLCKVGLSKERSTDLLKQLKDLSESNLEVLSKIATCLTETGVNGDDISDLLLTMTKIPDASDHLLYLKDFPKENLKNFSKIISSLVISEIDEDSIYNFLCKLKDVPEEKLALLSSLATTLQNKGLFASQIDTTLLQLKEVPLDRLKVISDLSEKLNEIKLHGETLGKILREIKNIPIDQLKTLADLVTNLCKVGLSKERSTVLLKQLKDLPKSNLEVLSKMAICLTEAGVNGDGISDLLLKITDLHDKKLETLFQIASCLKGPGDLTNKIHLILLELKNASEDQHQLLLPIAKDLQQAKWSGVGLGLLLYELTEVDPPDKLELLSSITTIITKNADNGKKAGSLLTEIKDASKERLELLLEMASSLKEDLADDGEEAYLLFQKVKDLSDEELKDIFGTIKKLKDQPAEVTTSMIANPQSVDEDSYKRFCFLVDVLHEINIPCIQDLLLITYATAIEKNLPNYELYRQIRYKQIDFNKINLMPDQCKIALAKQSILEMSPSTHMMKWVSSLSPLFKLEEFIHSLESLATMDAEDLKSILSPEAISLYRENYKQLQAGVKSIYSRYKSELLSEKYDFLGIDEKTSFSSEYDTQTMPGLAIMATRFMQKHHFNNLFVCDRHLAVKNKFREINENPKDQRCAIIVAHDYEGREIPSHKVSLCIEKRNGVLNVFLLDSIGDSNPDYTEKFFEKIKKYLDTALPEKNYVLTKTGLQREYSVYGCEIFALHDAKNFLQNPNFMQEITTEVINGEPLIKRLPPVFMIGTQSSKIFKAYIAEDPSIEQQTLPSKQKTIQKHREKYTENTQNHYITNKTIKYMHFVTSCLKALPKERIQAIIKQSLLM